MSQLDAAQQQAVKKSQSHCRSNPAGCLGLKQPAAPSKPSGGGGNIPQPPGTN